MLITVLFIKKEPYNVILDSSYLLANLPMPHTTGASHAKSDA